MNDDFNTMEELIFRYFLDNLERYVSTFKVNNNNFNEILNKWADNKLNSPVYFNQYMNEFFGPELNISARELLTVLKQNKITFKQYILGIMNKFDTKEYLKSDKLLNESAIFEDASKQEVEDAKKMSIKHSLGVDINLDNLNDDELDNLLVKTNNPNEVEEPDETEQKKNMVKSLLGNENLDVNNLSDEELQQIIDRQPVNEKVDYILSNIKDREMMIECLHKYVGFTLSEAKMVVDNE